MSKYDDRYKHDSRILENHNFGITTLKYMAVRYNPTEPKFKILKMCCLLKYKSNLLKK